MIIRRRSTLAAATGLLLLGCGTGGGSSSDTGETLPGSAPTSAEPTDAPNESSPGPTDTTQDAAAPVGFRTVTSLDQVTGFWVPVEVDGEPVDGVGLGAFLGITSTDERVGVDGYDGCNDIGGNPTGVRPAFDDGRFAGMEFGSTMQGCDFGVAVSPGPEGLLFVSDAGDELFVDQIPFTGSIRYVRIDERPVDPRQADQEAEQAAEEAARQAEEAAERATADAAEADARSAIRTGLPEARAQWEAAGIDDYTLRFENASLMNDPSFPNRRPVGGVWEIEVVDGVALENEWSDSILGDTVDDWFAYVASQLDSHYLRVEFDPVLGAPTLIDSQPLDDMAIADPNELTAWLVAAEIVVPS